VTRETTMRDDSRVPDRRRWIDLGGRGKFKTWRLDGTEFYVKHCGHPTALFPWYGLRPDGSIITSGRDGEFGYAFRFCADAKVATELEYAGQRHLISLVASGRRRKRRR
jgi:hypothetical protein